MTRDEFLTRIAMIPAARLVDFVVDVPENRKDPVICRETLLAHDVVAVDNPGLLIFVLHNNTDQVLHSAYYEDNGYNIERWMQDILPGGVLMVGPFGSNQERFEYDSRLDVEIHKRTDKGEWSEYCVRI